jgi:peptide/nickel transport system permease protein
MFGARLAWMVGGFVALGSAILGSLLGLIGGYYGGLADFVFSRVIDALVGIPGLLLALVFAAIFGPGIWTAVGALVMVSSPVVGRVVRSAALVERELDYVRASRGVGNREIRTLAKHVFPNVAPGLFVVATQIASRSILVEASLSFLGLGTQPPSPSWGLMIKEGRSVFLSSPEVVIVPALILTVTVLAINMLSDALNDWLDPAAGLRPRRGRHVG